MDSSVSRCKHVMSETSRQKMERFHTNRRSDQKVENSTTRLTLPIKYVVLPVNSSGIVATSKIESQQTVLNTHFGAYQKPTTSNSAAHYPYYELNTIMGDPNITFTHTIQTMSIVSPAISGFSTVEEAEAEYKLQGGTITAGTIHVYITKIVNDDSGTILGMAKDIVSNALMIDPGTVGSSDNLGSLGATYGAGKTLIHELGHCFGLLHPFPTDGSCTSVEALFVQSANPQSPPQKNPNYYTTLTEANGLDNRGRDALRFCTGDASCQASTTTGLNPGDTNPSVAAYSCATRTELTSATLPYETFMIFMDYGADSVMIGFPTSSVSTMRSVILDNSDLFSVNSVITTATPTPEDDDSSFPTWAIIVISVVGGLILIAIVVGASTSGKSRMKPLQAYAQPFLKKIHI